MRSRYRRPALAPIALLALGALLGPLPAAAETDCDSTLEARLDSEEPEGETVHLQFAVDVRSEENCAKVIYDLVLEIRTPNGQVQKVRKPRVIKLSDGALTDMVKHEMAAGSSVVDYRATLVECIKCSM